MRYLLVFTLFVVVLGSFSLAQENPKSYKVLDQEINKAPYWYNHFAFPHPVEEACLKALKERNDKRFLEFFTKMVMLRKYADAHKIRSYVLLSKNARARGFKGLAKAASKDSLDSWDNFTHSNEIVAALLKSRFKTRFFKRSMIFYENYGDWMINPKNSSDVSGTGDCRKFYMIAAFIAFETKDEKSMLRIGKKLFITRDYDLVNMKSFMTKEWRDGNKVHMPQKRYYVAFRNAKDRLLDLAKRAKHAKLNDFEALLRKYATS